MKENLFNTISQKIEKWGIDYISPDSSTYESLENNDSILVSSGSVLPNELNYKIGFSHGRIYVVCKPEIVEKLKLLESSIKYELSKKIWLLEITHQTRKDLYDTLRS